MTEPHDANTRPISVAELLAKNGTIGAPVPNRRRRRRGNSDAVTVAELTGEIPVIDDDIEPEATGQPGPESHEHARQRVCSARGVGFRRGAGRKVARTGPNPSRGGRNPRRLVRVNHGPSRGNRAPSAVRIRCRRATTSGWTPAFRRRRRPVGGPIRCRGNEPGPAGGLRGDLGGRDGHRRARRRTRERRLRLCALLPAFVRRSVARQGRR